MTDYPTEPASGGLDPAALEAAYRAQQKALEDCKVFNCQRDHLEVGIRAYLAALRPPPAGVEELVDAYGRAERTVNAAAERSAEPWFSSCCDDRETRRAAILNAFAALRAENERLKSELADEASIHLKTMERAEEAEAALARLNPTGEA